MRVLNLLMDGKDGGAEKFFMRFGSAMHTRGVEQLMVMNPHLERQAYFEEHEVPYLCIDFNKFFGLWGRWRLHQKVGEFQPDIIIAWLKDAARWMPEHCRAFKIGRAGGPYKIQHYKNCDYIIANSIPIRDFMQQQGRQDVTCISNFIKIGPPSPKSQDRTRPLLFFHGRLHPQKGLDVLIEALPHVDADVQIAGAGPLEQKLRHQAEATGVAHRIDFLGWHGDASTYLGQADLYVFPSRYEGTSNSLLEAMAYGKPIVTTNGESVSWFLTHEENALIVDVDNSAQLARAINRLLADPELARRLGENARKLYQEQFDEEAICRQWITFCENALQGRAAEAK